MPESRIVVNTTPILSLIAGLGSLTVLRSLYSEVVVPFEVAQEICAGQKSFGIAEFSASTWLARASQPIPCSAALAHMLDPGEASVVATALERNIPLVCIDETAGRRVARLHSLRVTGSLGVLLRAKNEGHIDLLAPVLQRMIRHGIWLTAKVQNEVLRLAGE